MRGVVRQPPVRAVPALLMVLGMIAAACSSSSGVIDEALEQMESAGSTLPAPGSGTGDEVDPLDPTQTIPAPEPDPTPLPIDTEVRIGVLDNGLTYYVRSNDAPGSNLDVRLVVNAGSVHELEPERGGAHFLEHMLFNGTEAYPGNELDLVLRSLGSEIGPDLNAYTSYDETVYFLTVSTFDRSAADTAFDILREWAGAATITEDEVVAERGVVREEHRERVETSDGYVNGEFDRIYTAGTPYEGREPIGQADNIMVTESAELRAFYDTWYRPEEMAVIAVGDFSLDELEEQVVSRFESLEARGPAGEHPSFDPEFSSPGSSHVVTEPDQPSPYMSLDIALPQWDRSTYGGERMSTIEALIIEMLGTRLSDAFSRGQLEVDSEPGLSEFAWSRNLRYMGTGFLAGELDSGLQSVVAELLGPQVEGFTREELDRAIAALHAALDAREVTAATTQDAEYADLYVAHFLEGADISATEASVTRVKALTNEISVFDVTNHYRWILQQSGPIAIAVGSDPNAMPTPEDLEAAITAATPAQRGDEVAALTELLARPEPAEPSTEETLPNGATEWTFANGTRVRYLHSDIGDGTVQMLALGEGGWSLLDPGAAALVNTAVTAVANSGLGDLDSVQVDRFMADSTAYVEAFIDETTEGFYGSSTSDDLEDVFALMYLLVTGPSIDDVAFRQAVAGGRRDATFAATDPASRAFQEYLDARYGSEHTTVATPDQFDTITAEGLLELYTSRLDDVDDMVIAVVGDVDEETVGELARHYIGTLPTGEADTWVDLQDPPPPGVVTRTITLEEGSTDAGLLISHSSTLEPTPKRLMAARVLQTIVNERLFDRIREDLATTYGGSAQITGLFAPDPIIESALFIDGDPERIDEMHAAVLEALRGLGADGPTGDEYDRAFAVVENDMSFLGDFDQIVYLVEDAIYDIETTNPTARLGILSKVTIDDVRELAASLYASGDRIEVIRRP